MTISTSNQSRFLEGRRVLVAGGTGEVGEGIVRQLLRAGATVVVPSRERARFEQLRDRLVDDSTLEAGAPDRLEPVTVDVSSETGADQLARHLVEGPPLDAAIATLGGWWQGAPLTEVSLALWQRLLDASLTAHFLVARAVLPLIASRPGASYTLINGAGGLSAVPGAGPISVSAAAQLMLKDVLAAEHRGLPVRINSLVIATPVLTRSRPSGPAGWLSADEVGRFAAQLSSDRTTSRGETIVLRDHSQLES